MTQGPTTAELQGWRADVPAVPDSVSHLRRALSAWARELGVSDALVGDIALAVTEAATNAVVHAFEGLEPGTLTVRAEPGDETLDIRVADDGRGMTPRPDSPGLGLGLPIVGQLTETFDIRAAEGGRGTEVRMVFAVPGMRAPARVAGGDGDWRVELLAEVSRLAGEPWPGTAIERLLELVVPAAADACTLDLVEGDSHRRVGARLDGDEELSTWLRDRRPPEDLQRSVHAALRGGEIAIFELDEEANRSFATEPGDLERMTAADLRWWVSVPLGEGDALLGSLGLGLGPQRPSPHDQRAFLAALGERASRGLVNTRLIEELERSQARFERILAVLSEAVTVHDPEGRIVFANPAAVELLGLDSVDEVLAAQPGELAARFEVTDRDGAPVAPDSYPGFRLLQGLDAPPLLTRSILRETGRARWLLTKATLLDDGEVPLAVNIIDDVTAHYEPRG